MRQQNHPTSGQNFHPFPVGEVIEQDFDDAELELQDVARYWANYEEREAA